MRIAPINFNQNNYSTNKQTNNKSNVHFGLNTSSKNIFYTIIDECGKIPQYKEYIPKAKEAATELLERNDKDVTLKFIPAADGYYNINVLLKGEYLKNFFKHKIDIFIGLVNRTEGFFDVENLRKPTKKSL